MSFVRGLRAVLLGHSYMDQEVVAGSSNRPIERAAGTVMWANAYLGRPFEILQGHGIGGERLIDIADRVQPILELHPDIIFWNAGTNDLKNTQNVGNSRYTGEPYVADPHQTDLTYLIMRTLAVFSSIKLTGALIVMLPETSPANGAPDQTKHLAARTLQFNKWLRWVALTDSQFLFVPLDSATYDVTSNAGNVNTSFYADFIHIGVHGAKRRGWVLANTLRNRLPSVDRLINNVVNTYTNLKLVGTSLATNNDGTLRVMLPNASGANSLIRTGDIVSLAVPSAANTLWNGTYNVVGHTASYIDVDCDVAGAYTGTINVSTATNMFDNPLFLTQTGGSFSGAGTLTSGTVPSGVLINCPAGSSVVINNNVTHTDMNGQTDAFGKWMNVTITGSPSAAITISLLSSRGPLFPASSVYGRIFAGDVVQGMWDFEVVGTPSGIFTIEHALTISYSPSPGGATDVISFYRDTSETDPYPQEAARLVCGTAEYQLLSDRAVETVDGRVYVKFTAAGGTAHIRIGRASVSRINKYTVRDVSRAFEI